MDVDQDRLFLSIYANVKLPISTIFILHKFGSYHNFQEVSEYALFQFERSLFH
jgi:hypothetical protein